MTILLSDPVSAGAALTTVRPRARARLAIDLTAVAANVRRFATVAPDLMAVVKADGYGHGGSDVARTALAHGARSLGVTSVDEGLALRAEGLTAAVLTWLNPVDADWDGALAQDLEIGVPSVALLTAVAASAERSRRTAAVHLHLDCGLARDGADPATWLTLCRRARQAELQGLVRVAGVMGHLPCADLGAPAENAAGRRRFLQGLAVARATGLRPARRHLAATSATLTDPAARHTLCRVGAGLVGIDPTGLTPLVPAQTFTAPVVAVREVRAGTGVGYDHTWRAPRRTRLATIAAGYADGVPRVVSGRAAIALSGRRCAVVGRVSMDQVVVDVGDLPVAPDAQAVLWGRGGPTAAEWARWAGTIEHEIVTGVGRRVLREVTR